MANFFTNATDVTPATLNAWVDVNVSAYVPAGATGVILQAVNPGTGNYNFGLRKKGSTDSRTDALYTTNQAWGYIGLDANRVFQTYLGNAALKLKLLGYFTTDGSFFTNAYDKTPAGSGSWVDIDCSAEIPSGAKYAVVEIVDSGGQNVGLRAKGSTDNRTNVPSYHTFALVALDANRVFQYYRGGTATTLYLVGYLTVGTPKTNGVDVSLGSIDVYQDIDRGADPDAGATAVGVLVEVVATANYKFALREKGGSDDFYQNCIRHTWAAVGLNANKVFEGKINNTAADFFVLGYLLAPPQTFTYVGSIDLTLLPQSVYGKVITKEYVGSIPLALLPQGAYGHPSLFIYAGSIPLSLLPQGIFDQEWRYVGSVQVSVAPQGDFFFGRAYTGSIQLFMSPQGDYLSIIGRKAIPGPYILRYPSPQNGETNVPVKNGIRFTLKSDGPGIDIDKVRVKIVDSWGTNIYDKTSPYFKYSGNKFRYEIEVLPPQPWVYEEDVQTEIEAEDFEGRRGLAYEYVP